MFHYCGKQKHNDRSKECKAFGETCDKCGKVGHFKVVCRSKKKQEPGTTRDPTQKQEEQCNLISDGVFSVEEHGVHTLSSGDLSYNKQTGKWVQKPLSKGIKKVPLQLDVCDKSYSAPGLRHRLRTKPANIEGVPDTGCSVLCGGPDLCKKFDVKTSQLLRPNITLRVADGKKLTILGSLPVNIRVRDGPCNGSKQLLHIVEEFSTLFVGRACLQDLGIIGSSFPLPQEDLIV